MEIQFSPTPSDDTAAAIVAAIACYIQPDSTVGRVAVSPRSAWRAAGLLEAQGLPPWRGTAPPKWSAAERSQRATRWSVGITGM